MTISTHVSRNARRALSILLSWASVVVPPGRDSPIVIAPGDANADAMIDEFERRGRSVTVLANKSEIRRLALIVGRLDRPLVKVRCKTTVGAFWRYLRAPCIIYTHGLYNNPRLFHGRLVINLWHGDGPKASKPLSSVYCTHVVAASRPTADHKASHFGVPIDHVLLYGNPRWVYYEAPADECQLEALGLKSHGFILYAPTYRVAQLAPWHTTRDGEPLADTGFLERLVEVARGNGLDVVLRPHPLDMEIPSFPGLVLSDEKLDSVGLNLYQVLPRAAGLITDYSSLLLDMAALGGTIGIYAPDLDEYARSRGLAQAEWVSWLEPLQLRSESDLTEFCAACNYPDGDPWREKAACLAKEVQLVNRWDAARHLASLILQRDEP